MRRGTESVLQVNPNGDIVHGEDFILSVKELYDVFNQSFPNVKKNREYPNTICAEKDGTKYLIRTKNITYLGNPHKKYKKRYQLPEDIKQFYAYAIEKGYCPLIIGVYSFEELRLFVDFSIETYVDNVINNSSAHVYVSDLQQVLLPLDEDEEEDGKEDGNRTAGYFEKVDTKGNRITVFDVESVDYYLTKRVEKDSYIFDELQEIKKQVHEIKTRKIGKEKTTNIDVDFLVDNLVVYGNKVLPDRTRNIILNYFAKVKKHWFGVECYKEMLEADYRNKNQAEWPGFYLEYSFEKYLFDNGLNEYIHYAQEKIDGGIDLDLFLADLDTYGDLKAHTSDKKDIPGNKTETVENVLVEKGKVIYIVCVHDTEKDLGNGLEVTKYWNENKTNRKENQNPLSYSKRMKRSVDLKKVEVLSIDATNVEYLKGFTQGKNNNGKPRKVKIMIDGEKINKFLKLSYTL